jgi:glyoxylase-like metal-dependent hydrolase (beta-lactamase superfamily II)
MDWSDLGRDRRVAAGLVSPEHAANVKSEVPSPRVVEIAPVEIMFRSDVYIDLGGVGVQMQRVGGDHSADSSVMFVEPDRVLFLGDCLYPSPTGDLTAERALPVFDAILSFDADVYVCGHDESVLAERDVRELIETTRARLA